jgi:hypothetical protein
MGTWFDSTDLAVHKDCAKLCATCPAIAACRAHRDRILEQGHLIEGTWAGELYGAKPPTEWPTCGSEQTCERCIEGRTTYERNRKRRQLGAVA